LNHAHALAAQFGFAPREAPAPAVDVAALKAAIEKVETDYDLADLREMVKKLEAAPAATPAALPPPQAAVQPRVPQPAPRQAAPAQEDPDSLAYGETLTEAIKATGTADPRGYFLKSVWPAVLADIQQRFPGRDPVKFYEACSARSKYDLCDRAFQGVQKQTKALRPSATSSTPATPRPVSSSGTSPTSKSAPTTGVNAAISFLTDGE
jgi:hypothetical protein